MVLLYPKHKRLGKAVYNCTPHLEKRENEFRPLPAPIQG
jgi:hypothetical protein